jgi:hypothetical protein
LETHADITERGSRTLYPTATRTRRPVTLTWSEWLVTGSAAGLLAGVLMAVPLLLWDWARASHIALEVTTAPTAWLFGLNHFSHDTYRAGPIALGIVSLCVYWIVSGLVFTAIADRLFGIDSAGKSLIAGAAWSFVSFVFFWYMLLPIARDGAPFRETAVAPGLFVAPNWVWILAFTIFGVATGAFYALLRPRAPSTASDNGRG